MRSRSPTIGDIVAGKYRVERLLGEGGMGIVLGARHITLDERVAIKVLKADDATEAEATARFLREARAAVRIKGEHVARVLDVGELEDGTPYMAMEYLDGADLAHVVERHGVLPVGITVDYVLQTCEALAEAHALGIVHRDIKPSNLFLTRKIDGSSCVKVLDFGISKSTNPLESNRPDFNLTQTQTVLGSPLYMAPEQMRSSRRVDARTDIWSIGTIMHELLTGHPPFSATTMPELCAMILQDPAPSLRLRRADVPEALDAIVGRCLQKAPEQRPASVLELARGLEPFGTVASQGATERIERVTRNVGAASLPHVTSSGSTPALAHANTAPFTANTHAKSPTRRFGVAALIIAACAVGAAVVAFGLTRLQNHRASGGVGSSYDAMPSSEAPLPSAASTTLGTSALQKETPASLDGGTAPLTITTAPPSVAPVTPIVAGGGKTTPPLPTGGKKTERPGPTTTTPTTTTAPTVPTAPPVTHPAATASSRYD